MEQDEAQGTRRNRRDERTEQASAHIADVDARLKADVDRSLEELKTFDASLKAKGEGCVPEVRVVDQTTGDAIMEQARGLASACDLAALDFASFTNPGGGYDRGAWAQEEALCSESTLYNVLREQRDWYGENRRHNINCSLYRNRGLVVPKVRFERDKYHKYADIIVVAAPNATRARADYNIDDETLEKAMRGRIRFVLAIADALGHDKLVLGAFGCGVFGWDAAIVAEMFRAELATGRHVASQVTFAVPGSRFDENLAKFEHAFAAFPSKNDDPYVSPSERVQEEVVEEEDEEEDDWRKYL